MLKCRKILLEKNVLEIIDRVTQRKSTNLYVGSLIPELFSVCCLHLLTKTGVHLSNVSF